MITTKNLSELPDIDELKKLMLSICVIDFIRRENNEYCEGEYHFYPNWNTDEVMISMYNGQGSTFEVTFKDKVGCLIIGYYKYSLMTPYGPNGENIGVWNGVTDSVPIDFLSDINSKHLFLNDYKHITFCIWRKYGDSMWHTGNINFPTRESHPGYSEQMYNDPDGSKRLLHLLDGDREKYLEWAIDTYWGSFDEDEVPCLDLETVNHIFDHKPITEDLIKKINPEASLEDKYDWLREVSYPIA